MIIRGVKMEVYVEAIYIMHLTLIIISYQMVAILLNVNWHYKKVCLYSLVTSISYISLYIDRKEYVVFIIWAIVFIFLFKRQVFLFYPVFLVIYFSLVHFMASMQSSSYVYNGLLLSPWQYSNILILCIAVIFSILQVIYIIYGKRTLQKAEYMYPMKIMNQEETYYLQGFLDSGNEVFYLGFPLLLVNKSKLPKYQVIDTILVDNIKDCCIEVVQVERVYINNQELKDVYIGMVENIRYDCLLNKQLMGGIL